MSRDHSTSKRDDGFDNTKEWEMRIPVSLFAEAARSLSERSMVLLLTLEGYARKSDVCWPSNKKLGEALGVCPRKVQLSMAELVDRGYVRRETLPDGKASIRLLKRISRRSELLDFDDIPGEGGRKIIHGGGARSCAQNKDKLNKGAEGEFSQDVRGTLKSSKMTRREAIAHAKVQAIMDRRHPEWDDLDRNSEDSVDRTDGGVRA